MFILKFKSLKVILVNNRENKNDSLKFKFLTFTRKKAIEGHLKENNLASYLHFEREISWSNV